jgi:hypothetical protein
MTDAPDDVANDMCLPLVMCPSPDLFPCNFIRTLCMLTDASENTDILMKVFSVSVVSVLSIS